MLIITNTRPSTSVPFFGAVGTMTEENRTFFDQAVSFALSVNLSSDGLTKVTSYDDPMGNATLIFLTDFQTFYADRDAYNTANGIIRSEVRV